MANFDGGATDDVYVGSDANDDIKGNGGNDRLTGGGGNDVIDGGAGTDFAIFLGLLSDYRFVWDAVTQRLLVSDLRPGAPDGTDIVTSIERFQFSNVTINLNQALARAVPAIQGTTGDDSISPTASPAGQPRTGSLADMVNAGNGQDMVDGGGGNDFLHGEAGNDTLVGGDGADRLDGGDGDDTLYAGQVSPPFNNPVGLNPINAPLLDTASDVDTLVGGAGNDRIFAGYGDHVDGSDNDAAGDTLFISFQGAYTGVAFDARLATQVIGGGTITGIEGVGWLEGSQFDDVLQAGTALAPIFGMGGNDHIVGLTDAGNLYGGDGDDIVDARGSRYSLIVDGGNGDDILYTNSNSLQKAYGGEGNDVIYGHGEIHGGGGNDRIIIASSPYGGHVYGGAGDDEITITLSGALNSTLYGEAGNDRITGGVGNDRLDGGAGDDLLIGGAGNGDRAFYTGRLSDYRIINDSANGQLIIIDLRAGSPDGTDVVRTVEQFQFLDGPRTLAQVTAVAALPTQGTAGNDTITTTGAPAGIAPTTAQADVVYAGAGDDRVLGGAGNDWLHGEGDNDILAGGAGADTLNGGDGADTLYSGDESPAFNWPDGPDPYVPPVLDTGTEVDTLIGGEGADRIFAGYGDHVDGGGDNDTLYISFLGASSGVTADFTLATLTMGGGTITGVESFGWIEGSQFDDAITVGNSYGGELFTSIFGHGGNDMLVAGYYTANLYGGTGNDMLDARGSQYLYAVDGGEGDDLIYAGTGLGHIVHGGDGNDIIHGEGRIFGDAGNDKIFLTYSPYARDIHGGDGDDEITAFAGGYAYGNSSILYGDAGNDRLTGGASKDNFNGGAGNDHIVGGAEDDMSTTWAGDRAIYSGNIAHYSVTRDETTGIVTIVDLRPGSPDGTDTLEGVEVLTFANGSYLTSLVVAGLATGQANFTGTAGDDVFQGSETANQATGSGGNDMLYGNGGNDILTGGVGHDRLEGGTGNDRLYSDVALGTFAVPEYHSTNYITPQLDRGSDIDILIGGDGNDILSAGFGDHVDGGDGNDTLYISFMAATSGVTADFGQLTVIVGGGTITGVDDIGWIEGSNFDDHITVGLGSPYANFGPIFGMGGNDHLVAGYYTGALFGGSGNDIVDGRDSQYLRMVDGGDGDDILYTRAGGTATAYGGAGNDIIYAHGYGAIFGDDGNDKIYMQSAYLSGDVHGGDGDDEIVASPFANPYPGYIFYGDAGNDRITGGAGTDLMSGGAGNDTIIGGDGNDLAIFTGRRSDYRIAWDPVGQQFILTDLRPGSPDGTDVVHGVERFQFSDGIRQATALPAIAVKAIQGTTGDDLITPTSAPAGQAMPGAQVDVIYGGAGNDTLQGGGGDDWMYGGTGHDNYIIEDAGDHMVERAGEGIDTAKTGTVDLVLGDHVENGMLKGALALAITGNGLDNDLRGNGAANVMTGGGGADLLTGGGGADVFKYLAASDSTVDLLGRDTIFDFSQLAGDRIDLAGIDADGNAANGDSAFAFIGDGDFTMVAGQLRSVYDGTNTLVYGDIDGDGNADFAITLAGEISLTGTDFYL